MNAKQDPQLMMETTLTKTLNRYPTITAQIPAFVMAMGDLGVKVAYIEAQALIQAGKTTGLTLNKTNAKKAMCDKAFEISSAVGSYASTVKNAELAAQVDFTYSDIARSRDIETAGLCENIRTLATNNLVQLADYAVTAADLTDLAKKIAAYKSALANPTDARVSKKTATANIEAGFIEFDDILENRMDKLMPKFQAISADFVKDYWNARNIVDIAASHASPTPAPPTPATK